MDKSIEKSEMSLNSAMKSVSKVKDKTDAGI